MLEWRVCQALGFLPPRSRGRSHGFQYGKGSVLTMALSGHGIRKTR